MRITLTGICICLLLLCDHDSFAQCPAAIPLSITNVTTTESRCQTSGTAEVLLTGGTAPFTYRITAGPVLFPDQSSNLFQSLMPGNYTVRVTDNCNTSTTANFTITGSYTVPSPSHFLTPPTCPGGNDGKILIGVMDGRPPFSYALISPSPVTVPAQSNNEFTNLPAGIYTYEVTDSCGNFQTRTVTLPDGNNGAFFINQKNIHYEGCDSFSVAYTVRPYDPNYIRLPFTMTLTLPDGTTKTHVINNYSFDVNLDIIRDTFYFSYHHINGAQDPIPVSGVNGCGYTTSGFGFLSAMDMYPNPITDGCNRDRNYAFEQGADNSPDAIYKIHCNNITYTLVSPAGAILATQTNNSTFSGYPPGIGYKVVREDCCGKDSITFTWEQRPALKINYISINPGDVCKEGAAGIDVSINRLTQGDIIVASGPPSITFGDGTVHNYVYPDTLTNMPFGTTSVRMNYFGEGAYTIYAVDTCGEADTATFTITPAQLRHSSFATTLKKGCIDDNKIVFTAQSNTVQYDGDIFINSQPFYPASYPYTDSAVNLPAGTYNVRYAYRSQIAPWTFLKGMSGYACDTINSTVVVPPYTQPAFAMSPAVSVCSGIRTIALLADSNTGVSPYRYRISAGASTTPLQNDNVFPNVTAGTYTFLIADACGNSFSNSVAIDTLKVPAINITGTGCIGSSTTLSLPANPYYTYSWQHPIGAIINGNTITLNPVSTNDTGTYVVTVTSAINGCTDSKTLSIQMHDCSISLPMTLLQFSGNRQGNTVVLQWKTTAEINTSHFVVERSTDGVHFSAIQTIPTSGETSSRYTATDYQPLSGKLYYRLQMVDKDGKATYSPTILINNDGNNAITVTPRLVTDNHGINVSLTSATQSAFIQITGIDGKVWLTKTIAKGSRQTTINTNGLAKGNYLVVYNGNGIRTAVQIVKL